MMDGGNNRRQQISALVDGELDTAEAVHLLKALRSPELRDTWDTYHQIGDVIRNEAMAGAVRRDFSARFAERLANEPVLLAPRRSLLRRMAGWPTTLAAVAAAGFGFFVAPTLFKATETEFPAASPSSVARVSHGSLLADASVRGTAADSARSQDYLLMHQSSHAAMSGVAPLARPALLDSRADD